MRNNMKKDGVVGEYNDRIYLERCEKVTIELSNEERMGLDQEAGAKSILGIGNHTCKDHEQSPL